MPELPATPHHESEALRSVTIERTAPSTFVATNRRGGTLTLSSGDSTDFTPVEALLAAIGACAGVDVDLLTSRRAEPESFEITVSGLKVRDAQHNHMDDVQVEFRVRFPEGAAGDEGRAELPKAVQLSHDRLCTVSRTVSLPTPVTMRAAD